MDQARRQQLFKRSLWVVAISQIFGGMGLAAGITVGALLAQDMLQSESFAGAPVALITLGSAGAAMLVGRLSQSYGRRNGLAFGFLLGGFGAIGVILSAMISSPILLFSSLLVYGSGTSTNLQARYAATDLAPVNKRATAISFAMVSTTFGAVAGPNLVNVMGDIADAVGIPRLAGPFLLAATAFLLAGSFLLIFLRPDPLLTALAIEKKAPVSVSKEVLSGTQMNRRGIIVGAAVMILTQIIMVAIMTMTPIHMQLHGHGLGAVGLVISIHVGAMFLPSLFTGILVDKLGRITMTIAAGVTLLMSGVVASIAPGDNTVVLTIALALLGLGWNFGLITGTTLIVDATTPQTRAKTQGSVDVLIALTGASSGVMSGMVVAQFSFSTLSLAGGCLAILLLPVVVWYRGRSKIEEAVGSTRIRRDE